MSPLCHTPDCPSNAKPKEARGLQQCRQCFRAYCRTCMHAMEARIVEYRWLSPQAVCDRCYGRVSRIESGLRELAAMRGKGR